MGCPYPQTSRAEVDPIIQRGNGPLNVLRGAGRHGRAMVDVVRYSTRGDTGEFGDTSDGSLHGMFKGDNCSNPGRIASLLKRFKKYPGASSKSRTTPD